jgi:hypothetical protein
LSSPQIAKQQDVAAESQSFIVAAGGPISAGQPIELLLAELPHHSAAPRWTALSLAAAIVVIGVLVASRRPDRNAGAAAERRRLVARRDKVSTTSSASSTSIGTAAASRRDTWRAAKS